jgi:hypothetical protein
MIFDEPPKCGILKYCTPLQWSAKPQKLKQTCSVLGHEVMETSVCMHVPSLWQALQNMQAAHMVLVHQSCSKHCTLQQARLYRASPHNIHEQLHPHVRLHI